jgi:hypothetical protein
MMVDRLEHGTSLRPAPISLVLQPSLSNECRGHGQQRRMDARAHKIGLRGGLRPSATGACILSVANGKKKTAGCACGFLYPAMRGSRRSDLGHHPFSLAGRMRRQTSSAPERPLRLRSCMPDPKRLDATRQRRRHCFDQKLSVMAAKVALRLSFRLSNRFTRSR